MNVFEVIKGDGPIVLAQPHGGTFLPSNVLTGLNARGQALADTDWHIARLYDGLLEGATIVRSNIHRYVIDANRDPMGTSLYPGQNTTSLCPLTDFDGQDIWLPGRAPSADEVEARRLTYHAPYHAALAEELDRVQATHGVAVLYDCHSIRSKIPFLFEGALPTFSIGTNGGTSCAPAIQDAVSARCEGASDFRTVVNGRFKGGWTTRHYGQPGMNVHAIQMELAQMAYMEEFPPWEYLPNRAARLQPILSDVLKSLDTLARSGALTTKGS
ncbi:N-formylglutamate deformylase [uncultured Sulfitobacter sp.]|uniref:N-formylglutamate deformylase n=1 Tax=uncultured Sulfitobacter sp. TaxID=191468 RepID=UPI00261AA6ED|nr:N-formylglutamate deformylase [uncultured Sulfitobacter sp.]